MAENGKQISDDRMLMVKNRIRKAERKINPFCVLISDVCFLFFSVAL